MENVKCPENIEELDELIKMIPLCRKSLDEQARARVGIGAAHSTREASRQIGKETGRDPDNIYRAIKRERQTSGDSVPTQKSQSKPVFNETNDNIEWAKWTWNPVTGCLHGCDYCYARDIANRFYKEKFKPTFRPHRLTAPKNTILPSSNHIGYKNVFVCSMADLFGEWVPVEWINAVIKVVVEAPQWNFIFLTKNPQRLINIEWPRNAWVGASVDKQIRVEPAERAFSQINATVKFVSCEPLLEDINFKNLNVFDWVIIGARSKNTTGLEMQPDRGWVKNLMDQTWEASCKLYLKPNLKAFHKEHPLCR